MPRWGVELRLDEVTPKLRGLTERMKQNIAKQADPVGQEMEDMAKSLAPVRTGRLRDSIYHHVNPEDLTMDFGNNVEYGVFVEFGTRRMAAQPHIRPALDAKQQKLLDAILAGCLDALSK